MRVSVLCPDALLRDGLQSLLSRLPMVSVVPTDGRLSTIAPLARQGEVDAIVVPLDGLLHEDFGALRTLKSSTGVRLVGIVPGKTLPSAWAEILDKIATRASGAEGLRQALLAASAAHRNAFGYIREPVPRYGSQRLTRREMQVAQLVSQGLPNRKIAETLGIREQSVKNLVSVLMRKLQCENRVQVALQLTGQSAFNSKV